MSVDLRFTIPLPPTPKGRPRAAVVAGRARLYTPTATRSFEAAVAIVAAAHYRGPAIDEPVRVDILCVLARPKRLQRRKDPAGLVWAAIKPDRDNLAKAVLDGLSGIWRDDCIVVAGETLKAYAELDGRPRVEVRVRSVDCPPWEVWEVLR